MNHSQTEVG